VKLLKGIFDRAVLGCGCGKTAAHCHYSSKPNRDNATAEACRLGFWRSHLPLIALLSVVPVVLSGCGGSAANSGAGQNANLAVSPNIVSFGGVPVGKSSFSSISIMNQTTAPATVSQVNVSGAPFTVVGVSDLPVTVAAGGNYSFYVYFSPVSMGKATGKLTIASTAAVDGTMNVTLSGSGATASSSNALSGMVCSNVSLTGAGTDSCTVTLNAAAGTGGQAVYLYTSDPAVSVPTEVIIPAGASTLGFTATVASVSTAQTATLAASAGGVTESFALQLNAAANTSPNTLSVPVLSGLVCGNASITGAGTDTCTVTLNGAASSGGMAVNLTSNDQSVTMPATVTVPSGATSAGFTATVASVSTAQMATLTASAGGVTKNYTLQLNIAPSGPSNPIIPVEPVLSNLVCGNASITGAGTDNCTVTLNGAATGGGLAIGMASNNSAVTVPASVTVPAGATSAGFTATVASVSSTQTATLTASAGGVSETYALQLAVAGSAGSGLGISSTSVSFGNVALNTPTTQSVTLTPSGSAVTVSAAVLAGTGFSVSGTSFPLTLSVGQSATLNIQFDPTVAGSATGTITIASTSLTNPSQVISLSGTGVGSSYDVNLSWEAPTSSSDPIAGYIVYRAPGGSSSYAQLNSSAVTQTSFTDPNVQDGQTYNYIVESVDGSGAQSVPSNTATVAVP